MRSPGLCRWALERKEGKRTDTQGRGLCRQRWRLQLRTQARDREEGRQHRRHRGGRASMLR